jgi:hypothetical protein
MPDQTGDLNPSLSSKTLPGPAHLRHYPAHDLVAWRPEGFLEDELLDAIGRWLYATERALPSFQRFIDLTRITNVAVRTSHVFDFAQKRTEKFGGLRPVKSAVFSEDWVGFGIARMYESLMEGAPIEVRAFRDRAKAAEWLGVPEEVLKLQDTPAPSR